MRIYDFISALNGAQVTIWSYELWPVQTRTCRINASVCRQCLPISNSVSIVSALFIVWKSSSTYYELRCEFRRHLYDLCWTCARHATSLKDFNICTNLYVFWSTFLRHCNGDWAVIFSFIFPLYFITWMIIGSCLAALKVQNETKV